MDGNPQKIFCADSDSYSNENPPQNSRLIHGFSDCGLLTLAIFKGVWSTHKKTYILAHDFKQLCYE